MGYLGEIFDVGGKINAAVNDTMELVRSLFTILTIPMIINCFFGYKIQKTMITINGAITGAVLGMLMGLLSKDTGVMMIIVIMMAVIGGFIAFKLYKFGIFMQYWLLGSMTFMLIFLITENFGAIGFSIVIGIITGILALYLNKYFIISVTSISGGMISGIIIGAIMGNNSIGIIFGIILAISGFIVQFSMEKKMEKGGIYPDNININSNKPINNGAQYNQSNHNVQKNNFGENRLPYKQLRSIRPNTYCINSRILIDFISLFKDDEGRVYIKLRFHNLGDNELIALYFHVVGYDIAGEYLGEQTYNMIDLNFKPNTKLDSNFIQVFNDSIRKVEVYIEKVVNIDYDIAKYEYKDTIEIPNQIPIRESINEDIVKLADIKDDELYLYKELEDGLWLCTCGHIGYHTCSYCGRLDSNSMRNTNLDIFNRIAYRVNQLIYDIDECHTIKELDNQRDKLEETIELLIKTEFSNDLLNKCKSAIDDIEARKIRIKEIS